MPELVPIQAEIQGQRTDHSTALNQSISHLVTLVNRVEQHRSSLDSLPYPPNEAIRSPRPTLLPAHFPPDRSVWHRAEVCRARERPTFVPPLIHQTSTIPPSRRRR